MTTYQSLTLWFLTVCLIADLLHDPAQALFNRACDAIFGVYDDE